MPTRRAPSAAHVARHNDSRMCLVLFGTILDNPGLADRLMEVLKPSAERSRRHDLVGFLSDLFSGWVCFERCLRFCGSVHLHLPHLHLHHGGIHVHVHRPGMDMPAMLRAVNFGTIAAFLAWFGGTGYLLAILTAMVCRSRWASPLERDRRRGDGVLVPCKGAIARTRTPIPPTTT